MTTPRREARAASGVLTGIALSGFALAALGIAIRVNNAVRYPVRWGFDALFNERYIERLLESWALPAPDSDWSTAHPPLFYYLSAGLGRVLGATDPLDVVVPTRLVSSFAGLLMVAAAVLLVRRTHPDDPRRALIAGALLLFLPVHIYMSAMLNEEIIAATFTSLAIVGACLELHRPRAAPPASGRRALVRDAAIGFGAGLALLTKLTGILSLFAVVGAYAVAGWRERALPAAIRRALVVTVVALAVGGWFYARNFALYGYLYPQDLSTHSLMFNMPPGERHVSDYFRVPLATWTDPQVLAPDLLRSIWGTTYVTLWYEGHGHFLPKGDENVKRLGSALLILALLPSIAFALGVGRGIRRAVRQPRGPDTPLLLLIVLTLSGYVVFTWGNPWFATVKGSYLLGMSVPFAYFASDVLADWTSGGGDRAAVVWGLLGILLLGVCVAFTQGIGLWDLTPPGALPGLQWNQQGMP